MPTLALPVRGVALAASAVLALAGCGMTVSTHRGGGTSIRSDAGVSSIGSTGHPRLGVADPSTAAPGTSSQPTSVPGTPTLSAAIRPGVFALGDSVMLGAEPALVGHHFRVDAAVGRQFFEGILELRAVNRTGKLPRNVVVHLGTNGTVTTQHCEAMVATAGPSRRVFFVTVFGPRSWMQHDDVVLRACAARHPVNVVLIDWASTAAQHPAWLGQDHIHPNTVGHKAYTALIASTVRRFQI